MSIITTAAVLHGPEDIRLEQLKLPELEPGQVLIGDPIGGICGTDVAKWRGDERVGSPTWLGHEFGGRVVAVGEGVTNVQLGDEVAAWVPIGWPYAGFAKHTIAQARHTVGLERRLAWAAEPLLCVINAVLETRPEHGPLAVQERSPLEDYGWVRPTEPRHIVVVGYGMMSLLATVLSRLERPASLVVIGRNDTGLARARRLGATHGVNIAGLSVQEVVEKVGRYAPPADVVYEGIGEQIGLDLATELTAGHGIVSPLGYHQSAAGRREFDMARHFGYLGKTLSRAHTRDAEHLGRPLSSDLIMPAMRFGAKLLRSGTVGVDALREPQSFPLAGIAGAFRRAAESGSGKVVVDSTL